MEYMHGIVQWQAIANVLRKQSSPMLGLPAPSYCAMPEDSLWSNLQECGSP